MITIRCTRSRGPRGFFCLHDVRRGPVNVDVIMLRQSLNEMQDNPTNAEKQWHVFTAVAFVAIASLMLAGCLLAKQFVLNTAISRGMGAPTSPLPGMLFSGLAFAAPIQSAFLLALLPYSTIRKVVIACSWMAIVMIAFAIGLQAHPHQDSPAMFRSNLLCILPLVAFGCYIPLGLLNLLRGWQFARNGSSTEKASTNISISSLFALTFVASLCLFALQFGPQGSFVSGLIGMLVGIVFGSFSSVAIYFIIKLRPVYSLVCYSTIGVGTYFVACQIMLAAGAGPMAKGNALFLSTLILTILSGFVVAKCLGLVFTTRLAQNA